jgi:flagellar hook-associated protein 3 FlgL
MKRISTNIPNDNMQYHMMNRQVRLNKMQNSMASQSRIQNLRDDPIAASHAVRYDSFLTRLDRLQRNAGYAIDNHRETETYMRQAVDIMHRIRELAVQGANGSYSKDDLVAMGTEVNELLSSLIDLGNARNAEGNTIFSGDRTRSEPFRAVTGHVPGSSGKVVTEVQYVGNINIKKTEISEGVHIETSFPGNQVFWAENQQIYSSVDSTDYVVKENSTVMIDGVEINFSPGDNIHAIMAKINGSGAPVKARLDPVRSSLVLQTTSPHQVWLEQDSGTVLSDLGILSPGTAPPPQNFDPTARVYGGSLFDMVIHARDEMLSGNTLQVGGSVLKGIDTAFDSLTAAVGDLGARNERLQLTYKRLQTDATEVTAMLSRETDLDLSEAITELKMLEYTHKAALSTASRIIQPTLLDFLR